MVNIRHDNQKKEVIFSFWLHGLDKDTLYGIYLPLIILTNRGKLNIVHFQDYIRSPNMMLGLLLSLHLYLLFGIII